MSQLLIILFDSLLNQFWSRSHHLGFVRRLECHTFFPEDSRVLDYVSGSHRSDLSKSCKHWDIFLSHCKIEKINCHMQMNVQPTFPHCVGQLLQLSFQMLPVITLPVLSQELRHAVKLPPPLANPPTVTDVTAGLRSMHKIQAACCQSYHILTGTKCWLMPIPREMWGKWWGDC